MLKIVMTIVTILNGHIVDRVLAEAPQAEAFEGAGRQVGCGFAANLAADRFMAKRAGASDEVLATDPAKYNYDRRVPGGPVQDIEYYSCNVPGRLKVNARDVGHLLRPRVINGANPSMG